MKIIRFENVESSKEARFLTKKIYRRSAKQAFSKDFGLRDQIQRASVSIMSNIAEGFDGGSQKAFANFLTYAYRSTSEVQSLLYVALDTEYINEPDFQGCFDQAAKTKRLIGGFIKYLRNSNN
jgi:four helix bundle protein